MTMFFSRISKLPVRKDTARFFSSLPQPPCLVLDTKRLRGTPEEGLIVHHKLFDPTTEKKVFSKEKKYPNELRGQPLLGASQGWVAFLVEKDLTVNLTDLHNPCVSSPRVISLPSLGFEYKPTTHATEVCLSSSDPVQDDFFVAAKFNEYHVSVCRPRSDSEWTHINTAYSLLPASKLMYSKRDKAFHFTSFKGLYMGSLYPSKNNETKYRVIRLRNMPKIPEAGWEMLDKCSMTNHLVESPSGELFFIKWYTQAIHKEDEDGDLEFIHSRTKRFMVFRQDGMSKDFGYTEDIGDLCIFLSESEAFCLSARLYPGLKPNSIYYLGPRLGTYDLASGTNRPFPFDRFGKPSKISVPCWIFSTSSLSSS
ncbi:hypothetical protein CARUB_v10028398mg [Capsella rubella]|uniref:KIB1-4 beta-propeller domain-containing protein n=1 Tax=Capsella rubella TaxID=81985 RepID=R0F1B2_9BRAS|nr:uncharacterized protein LOC17877292 [Capsella rubella]EOA15041.1 hypothetical protein CARUB_v10028398mg [Capsella rubella]